jgi:hypothetical protein
VVIRSPWTARHPPGQLWVHLHCLLTLIHLAQTPRSMVSSFNPVPLASSHSFVEAPMLPAQAAR